MSDGEGEREGEGRMCAAIRVASSVGSCMDMSMVVAGLVGDSIKSVRGFLTGRSIGTVVMDIGCVFGEGEE